MLAILLALPAPAAAAGRPAAAAEHDRFVVKFKDGAVEQRDVLARQRVLDVVARARGLRIGQLRRLGVGADVIRTDRALDRAGTKRLLLALRADPRVEYAEVDAIVEGTLWPEDAYFDLQWDMHDATAGINAPTAWDDAVGTGEVVAVVDSGITAHPDLDSNVLPGYDLISDLAYSLDGDLRDADPSDPGDFADAGVCGTAARNSSWHGTKAAGLVAAEQNIYGVSGVAPGAKVVPVRVLGWCNRGYFSDFADGVLWAAGLPVPGVPDNPNPAGVISLSLGGSGSCSTYVQNAINQAVAAGATVVAAAGNLSADVANFTPANCDNVIVVAASNITGARQDYSNFGAKIDVTAPGHEVLTTTNTSTHSPGDPGYGDFYGTSAATPHVAGVAALVRSWTDGEATPAAIESLIKANARPMPVACPEGCGAGLLDAGNTLGAEPSFITITDPGDVAEGDAGTSTRTFTVNLSKARNTPVTFDISTTNGNAAAGSDFVGRSVTGAVIPAGERHYSFPVTINGDTTWELDEIFYVHVSNIDGAEGVDTEGFNTLVNDDPRPMANGVTYNIEGEEGSQRLYKLAVPAGAQSLQFTLSNGESGLGEGDPDLYVRRGAPPTFGEYDCASTAVGTEDTCAIGAVASAGDYYVLVYGYTAYSNIELTGSYLAPVPNLSITDVQAAEADGGTRSMVFTVNLSFAPENPVTFNIATANGTAKAGTDFVAKSLAGQVIPAGTASRTFIVTFNGDTEVEANETLYANVANVVGATVVDAQGRGTIINDDGPTLSVTDVAVAEGNSGTKVLTFSVKLSEAAVVPVTYTVTTANGTASAGSDYVARTATGETITAGTLSRPFAVTLNGDGVVEGNETFRITLSAATGATIFDATASGTLLNDDGPVLRVDDVSVAEGHAGTKVLNFTVSLSPASAQAVTYSVNTVDGTATAGSDYVGRPLTGQTLAAGATSRTFGITINGDAAQEGSETFRVALSNAKGATIFDGSGTATILEDDASVLGINDVSIAEGNGSSKVATFTVTLSPASPSPVTYYVSTANGTATAGSDFTGRPSTGQTIAAGMTAKTFGVTIAGDTAVEPDETFTVNIGSATGATIGDGSGQGTITNDD